MIKIWAEPKDHEFFLGKYYPLKKEEVWWWIRSNNPIVQEWIEDRIQFIGTIPHALYTMFNEHPTIILSGDHWLDIAQFNPR